MSYCRFSEGDVYMLAIVDDERLWCYACSLASMVPTVGGSEIHDNIPFNTPEDALAHLETHRDKGHIVPEHAFIRLRREIKSGNA